MDDKRKTVAYQVRCSPDWLDRVKRAAAELGLGPAAYIRMVVTQRMNADAVAAPPTNRPPKRP
jgi:predicted DNA binding CopG/RHH family protein